MLTTHMEVLHKELAYVEMLLKKEPHLFIHEGLVTLVANLDIQIKSLEVACGNWDAAMKIIMEIHKSFLENTQIMYNP